MTLNSVHKPLNNSLFYNNIRSNKNSFLTHSSIPHHHSNTYNLISNNISISKRLTVLSGLSLFLTSNLIPLNEALADPSETNDLVLFIPDSKKTPAIRAGTVDPRNPYRFSLPATWKEAKVPNILSGNYCQPKCGEPWTEVIFEDKEEGKATVIACPLFKLTGKLNAKIEEIGTPNDLLESIGPYITGSYLIEDSVVAVKTIKQDDGLTYYYYEVNSPYAKNSQHSLSTITSKGEVALLFVVSATEKQWKISENNLRKVIETFRA